MVRQASLKQQHSTSGNLLVALRTADSHIRTSRRCWRLTTDPHGVVHARRQTADRDSESPAFRPRTESPAGLTTRTSINIRETLTRSPNRGGCSPCPAPTAALSATPATPHIHVRANTTRILRRST